MLTVAWYLRSGHNSRVGPLLGSGQRSVGSAGVRKVAVRLTRQGRLAFRGSDRLKLTVVVGLAPTGQPPLSQTAKVGVAPRDDG